MANTLAPFGFAQMGTASGPPNFASGGNTPYRISSGYTTAIFFGDLVRFDNTPLGFLQQWAVGDGSTATYIPVGIFTGCKYYSTSQKKTVWSNYWPGADATGDVEAFIVDDPNAEFMVQAGTASTPITQVSYGRTADIITTPVGNTVTGISGMTLGIPTTTNTLPFKVVNLVTTPPNANGRDITTAYNYVIVVLNNSQFKSLLGV